jgi:DNA-binding response OmpR family regulator
MRLLVVEDNHKIAKLIKKELQQENYVVDVAHDGATGFDYVTENTYDLIILDRLLPQLDGLAFCKKLRARDNHTPVLMLTAKGQTQDRIEGLDSGADDYMVKPFALGELLARVRALTRRPHAVAASTLSVGNLSLDAVGFEVASGNQPIKLSRKEFLILKYLMQHPGQIISKQQLIDSVWDYDSIVGPNNVEVYINRLRHKIDTPSAESLITTEKGFGYRLKNV